MNWIITVVIAAIALLVPAALYATFATTKDTYQYQQHYGARGYSQEIQTPDQSSEMPEEPGEYEAESSVVDPPVVNWPTEL